MLALACQCGAQKVNLLLQDPKRRLHTPRHGRHCWGEGTEVELVLSRAQRFVLNCAFRERPPSHRGQIERQTASLAARPYTFRPRAHWC